MAVDLQDDVSRLQACIFCGAGWADVLNNRSMKLIRSINLLFHIGSKIADRKAQLSALWRGSIVVVIRDVGVLLEPADSEIDRHRFAVAKDSERDVRSRGDLAHGNLERAAVGNLLPIDLRDDIPCVQATFTGR